MWMADALASTTSAETPGAEISARLRDHAKRLGSCPAVTADGRSLTYAELDAAAHALCADLRRAGIGTGTSVLLLPDISIASVVAYWALRIGDAVIAVGNPGATEAECAYFLEKTGARHVLAGRRAQAGLPPGPGLIWHMADADGVTWHIETAPERVKATRTDRAVILFSSGTTGRPKAIVHGHASILALHRTLLKTWVLTPDDVVLGGLPFHTIYGLLFSAGTAIHAGAHLVLLDRFRPETALAAMEAHRVTTAAMVPAMLLMMLEVEDRARFDLSSLRAVYTASAPISEHDIDRFAAFSGALVVANYGMTEIPGAVVEPAARSHRRGSVGRVSPGFEVVARDDRGRPLAPGETGEITMRGPSRMLEYLGDPEMTAARIRDGWVYSEDLGAVDADGYVHLSGRKSEMIIRGGLNISPREIEDALAGHTDVADAAVIGMPDRVLGEVVAAVVVPRQGIAEPQALEQALIGHCRRTLAQEKVPALVTFRDVLPRNDGGKVLRRQLVDELQRKAGDPS